MAVAFLTSTLRDECVSCSNFMKKLLTISLILCSLLGFGQANTILNQKLRAVGFQNSYIVGVNGDFTTLASAVAWLKTNMTAPTELVLDAGTFYATDSISINLTYNLMIRGLGWNVTTYAAAAGLKGKAMFNLHSPVFFERIYFVGSTLATYGDRVGENCFNILDNGKYYELKDFSMSKFRIGINLASNSEIYVFNAIIERCYRGMEFNSTGANIVDAEIITFINCNRCVNLARGVAANFSLYNLIFDITASDTAVAYDSVAYTYTDFPFMTGCKWSNNGVFLYGFDFKKYINRNIYMKSNIGMEDKKPHAKINVVGGVSATTITTAGTYYKAAFTNASTSYMCKVGIAPITPSAPNNRMVYFPSNTNACWLEIDGSISNNDASRTITVAIVKNGNTATLYGNCPVRCTTSGANYPFSLNVYLDDCIAGDYFEIYYTSSQNGNQVTTASINWYLTAQ